MRTADDIAAEEISRFQNGGMYWYDGISWITEAEADDSICQAAYKIVFDQLIKNGAAAGMRKPYIHHNGNGHYQVAEGDAK